MPGRKRKKAPEQATDSVADKEPAAKEEPAVKRDLGKMTVALLRQELQGRGMDTTGRKAELVARLEGAGADDTDLGQPDKPPSAKKSKVEEEEAAAVPSSEYGKAVAKLKGGNTGTTKKRTPKVDDMIRGSEGYTVVGDWDCMLNQTNIGQNNNKFYVIQLLEGAFKAYYVWTRWGRVGEPGMDTMKGPFKVLADAEKEFKKKFTDKTKNKWENRDDFTPVPGKYTLLEMDDDDEDEGGTIVKGDEPDAPPKKVKSCSLDKPTQSLVKMIFDNDMFNDAMKKLDLDTKKMPLGKLSKSQIAKGFEILEEMEPLVGSGLSSSTRQQLQQLSSRFYTIVPHNFGRRTPPVIDDEEMLRKKFDMLLVLGDIEMAQMIQKDQLEKESQQQEMEEVPHPLDVNYSLLQAKMSHLSPGSEQFETIQNYTKATEGSWRKVQLLDVWEMDRDGAGERFSVHDKLDNRRLLWHGTNVAVVAAILKGGLRIMPHSGGRVGKGIYFASENSKSAGYVGTTNDSIGVMFLAEVALGKEHRILRDNHTLIKPPSGFDSVLACGRTEPDPMEDKTITLGEKKVVVPQGKPISMDQHDGSSFSQSEYLVYKESQCRLRYLLKLKF